MIFLTVGTQFPFDRLVQAVDDLVTRGLLSDEIVAQVGQSNYTPRNFPVSPSLDKKSYDWHFQHASAVISHAGMGTITMALESRKPLLAVPRRKRYGEAVNDHQVMLAIRFETLGHILVACDETMLAEKVVQLKSFVPQPRKANPEAVSHRIADFLECLRLGKD